ncbi:MAG TPA: glycosyltransferase family 4 protein [Thermoanaerobaculia bacterium]|nr:glycosyltransferase family 4 protein [Thermoanaerobaculia bacterium]
MTILHLASYGRWTGAAAPAFGEVEALREASVDALYGYVGGGSLEAKIGHHPFAVPLLKREQDPVSVIRTIRRLRRFVREKGITLIHAHLSHDHWLAVATRRATPGLRLVRTFHNRRALRRNPLTRRLVLSTDGICVVNADFVELGILARSEPLFTPPPVNRRVYTPEGRQVRARYGIPDDVPLVGFIGKIDPSRGFEEAIRAFACLRGRLGRAMMMIIGRGPHRPFLERFASRLGVAESILWAGYHEDTLPEHYRAMNALLFTVPGSDEGHRAVSEALASGVPVACYPVPGIAAVLGEDLARRLVAPASEPEPLSRIVERVLADPTALRHEAVRQTERFDYVRTAERLAGLYRRLGVLGSSKEPGASSPPLHV